METRQTAQINDDLLRPLFRTTWRFYFGAIICGAVVAAAMAAFGYQVWNGIGVWGIDRPVFWAFDITNFVFWIGISHAGTLISAILRLANAPCRRPVTRCAEVITAFALSIGAIIPICHLGRPWLFYWLVSSPSPLPNWSHL